MTLIWEITNYFKEIYRGRTIYRFFLDRLVKRECVGLRGNVLDLASGGDASYHHFLPTGLKLVRTDYRPGVGVDEVVDLDQPLNYRDGSVDNIIFFNAIYTLNNQNRTLGEMFRILKPGGKLFVASPFIANEMPEPHDYCRLTKEGIEKDLKEVGFENFKIIRFGERFTSAAYLLHPFMSFNTIRLIIYGFTLLFDRFIPTKITKIHPTPLGYFIVAQK